MIGFFALIFSLLYLLSGSRRSVNQNRSPTLNEWNGLKIGQSSPAEAIHLLGHPRRNSRQKLRIVRIGKWITSEQRQRVWRALEYRDVRADRRRYKKVYLYFRTQRMVMVQLEARGKNRPLARTMPCLLDLCFTVLPFESAGPREGSGMGNDKRLPRYALVAATPRMFVSAEVKVSIFAEGDGERVELPGYVKKLQFISRSLENPKIRDPVYLELTRRLAS